VHVCGIILPFFGAQDKNPAMDLSGIIIDNVVVSKVAKEEQVAKEVW